MTRFSDHNLVEFTWTAKLTGCMAPRSRTISKICARRAARVACSKLEETDTETMSPAYDELQEALSEGIERATKKKTISDKFPFRSNALRQAMSEKKRASKQWRKAEGSE